MSGHAVVCDGYNTRGEYHLNFGWGELYPDEIAEAWYSLPTGSPSYLCAIQEIVLDIRPVPAGIDVDPATLPFTTVWGQDAATKTLCVSNNTTAALSIDTVTCPEGFLVSAPQQEFAERLENPGTIQAGQELAIAVKFSPVAAGNPRVYSACVDMGAYENQSDLPLLMVMPAGPVDMGAVEVEANETATVKITNTGKVDFEIERLELFNPRGVFSLATSLDDHPLASGDSVEVEIGFAPLDDEIYTGGGGSTLPAATPP